MIFFIVAIIGTSWVGVTDSKEPSLSKIIFYVK
jgi:hypothetical protein